MAAAASSESDGSRGAGSASARLDGADARATLALTPAEVAELLVTKPERIAVVDVREMVSNPAAWRRARGASPPHVVSGL
jgi:hypothetical protein